MPPCEYMVFDEDVIRSDELHKDEKDRIRHVINMFLEIFGMCEIVDTDHVPISAGNVRTVPAADAGRQLRTVNFYPIHYGGYHE